MQPIDECKKDILDYISDCVFVIEWQLGRSARISYANRTLEEFVGISKKFICNDEHIPPNLSFILEHDSFLRIIQEVIDTQNAQHLIFRVQNFLRQIIPMGVNIIPHGDRQCFCVMKQPTDRLQYLDIFEKYSNVMGDFVEYDEEVEDFKQLFASTKSLLQLGLTTSESIIGKYSRRDLGFAPEDIAFFVPYYKSFLARVKGNESNHLHEEIYHLEHTMHVGSLERIILMTSRFIGLSSARKPQFFLQSIDLTEQRIVEAELQKKKEDLKDLIERCNVLKTFFDNCPVLMGTIQLIEQEDQPRSSSGSERNIADSIHLFANPALATFMRRSSVDEIKGVRISEIIRAEELSEWHKHFLQSKIQQKSVQFEMEMELRGYPTKVCMSTCVSHVGGNQFVYLCQDITARKELETKLKHHQEELEDLVKARTKQLEEASDVKSRFLATVSHEMRTPLSGVLGMLSLLSEANLEPQYKEMVHIANVCGEQLMIVINDILDFSKIEQDKMKLESVPFSLYQIVEESLEVVTFESEKKQLDLVCDLDPNLRDNVIGDAARLRQVLINLLSNAVKFSPHGEVILQASGHECENGLYEILVSVSDQGIGIPEHAREQLFEPFHQVDNSYSRKYGGSGLGLSISKRLAELMGGKMWFESQEDKGSTFWFTIRCSKTDQESKPSPSFFGKRVIVIDKSDALSRILGVRLFSWGITSVAFKSIPEALASVTITPNTKICDLILVDSKQDIGGIYQLRTFNVPVVLMGATKACELDITLLTKPIRISKLHELLSKVFQNAPQEQNRKRAFGASEPFTPLRNLLILVAEDNLMNQRVIVKVLESIGYRDIEIAEDGNQALAAAKRKHFDVIFMDCMMPKMNGLEATERIRAEIPLSQQPVIIALTANAFPENRKRCFLAGMNFVLTKPLKKKELLEALNQFSLKETSYENLPGTYPIDK